MSKYDFSAYVIDENTTREYTFADLVGEPSLIVAVANDVNAKFEAYRVRKTIELSDAVLPSVSKAASIDERVTDMLRRLREDKSWDKDVIAHACVVGWGNPPVDVNGNTPEFSAEEALEFLNALPRHMLDPFINFVRNIYNFQNAPDPKEAAEKLGNS